MTQVLQRNNHYHAVLHRKSAEQQGLSEAEVIARWLRLHRLPKGFEEADDRKQADTIALWRERLVTEQDYQISEAPRSLAINSNQLGRWTRMSADEA